MTKYVKQTRLLVAVDCIIFGFDEIGKWSLAGGFIQPNESADDASVRILKSRTGLEGVYLEQLHAFSHPARSPIERTNSIAYFSLIDIHQYEKQLSDQYHPEWFPLNNIPNLIFDHNEMVKLAKEKLRYKAAMHPLLFELLPQKFTLPQLQSLYEYVYDSNFDKRNFSRKVLSTKLLVKQVDKDKYSSKKGAYYYKLNAKNYKADFQSFLNIIPNLHLL